MVRLTNFIFFASVVSGALSSTVYARTVHSVPIYKKVSGNATSSKALMARDLARFNVDVAAAVGEAPETNDDNKYVAAIQVGTQTFELIVDTGSSNTWVGAGTKYTPGSTATFTLELFKVTYGSGSVFGLEYTDNVQIGGLSITKQGIGSAITSPGITGVDGIIGFGPVDLTAGTVTGLTTVPTVMDNLLSQGTISTEVLGVSFAPENGGDTNDANGELTLGGTDPTKYSGTITYVSKTTASPYNKYWGIAVSNITYNGTSISTSANAVVDTGTTLIYLPTAAYNSFLTASGGTTDSTTGLSSWTTLPTADLALSIGGVSFSLTPSQFTVPAAHSSTAVDFIIGQKFLENYYSVFDTTNSRVGFAPRA
ncbi:Acid protease [Mycena sanguinolenta]|uniref:Acid protease n=1 Tax=Mycena sanguinolenta TaxID=230812 RepID=A0A8H7DH67_9AGAR|nr:Acid protease [Mycena sanguinolenta]